MVRLLSPAKSFMVGLVLLLTVGLGAFGIYAIAEKERLFAKSFQATVHFQDAGEIKIGTPVRMKGVQVGQVTQVNLAIGESQQTEVHVTLSLYQQLQDKLFANASAEITSRGLTGQGLILLHPGTPKAGLYQGTAIPGTSAADMAQVLAEVKQILADARTGKGTIGKLLNDQQLYADLQQLSNDARKLIGSLHGSVDSVQGELKGLKDFVRTGQEAITTIKQDADAIKSLPIVRSYIEDPVSLLVRPNCKRERKYFPETDLFEPGRATLTQEGRSRLDKVAAWLNANNHSDSEIVVLASSVESTDYTSSAAKKMTEKQAEAVVEYLRESGVHKLGFWSRRKVTPIGVGHSPLPVVEREALPPAAIQILLFVPEG